MDDLPRAKTPDDQQTAGSQQADDRFEEVHTVLTRSLACRTRSLAARNRSTSRLLLGEGLHHANAGNRIGQHAGHLAPSSHAQGKTPPQPVPHAMHQEGNDRQRQQRDHGQRRIEPDQNRGRQQQDDQTSLAKSSR